MKTYYLSKYALTGGIETVQGEQPPFVDRGYIKIMGRTMSLYRLGLDVHETMEEAVNAAKEQRDKKIASVKKQLAKLEAMTF